MTYFAELSPCGEEIILHKDNAIIGSFRPEMKAEADAIVRRLNTAEAEPTPPRPILDPMPVLFAAFDLVADDGGTHHCIRYSLPIGESGPDHDSGVLCEVFDGFAYDYQKVDEGNADPFDFIEAVAERMAMTFNVHDTLVAALKPFADLLEYPDQWGLKTFSAEVQTEDIRRAVAALKLVKDPR